MTRTPIILSTNIAAPQPDPGGAARVSGIHKVAAPEIKVSAPGPHYGDGSGVAGDVIGDSKHHGGQEKAVYAFASEKLAWWAHELGRTFAHGSFGENLTTAGLDLSQLLINQQVRIGTAVLEVSVPRTPCATFAAWIGESGWQKRFAASGDCGAYFRVVTPGTIRAGDQVIVEKRPAHDITMGVAFAAKMGNAELARAVWEARVLPPMFQSRLDRRFG